MKKNNITSCLVLLLFLSIFACCSEIDMDEDGIQKETETVEEAMQTFAVALSKAAYDNESLREYIKAQALSQFDGDYDVFYPWVKESLLDDGQTFQEELLPYIKEESLADIERTIPLLTLYVPDYSWLGAFCPEEWDITDSEVAVATLFNGKLQTFINGEHVGDLGQWDFPDFPVIVLKNNERLYIASETKSGELSYEFIDPVFDMREKRETKVASEFYYESLGNVDTPNNLVNGLFVNALVKDAYNEFGGNDYRYQRDYIYFGQTNQDTLGVLNTYVREYLYRFKFNSVTPSGIYESDGTYQDGSFPDPYQVTGEPLTSVQLYQHNFHMEGNLELKFRVILGNNQGSLSMNTITLNVPMSDLFTPDKVYVEFKHRTWFTQRKYIYTLNPNCLKPIWYEPEIQLPISTSQVWNLQSKSTIFKIVVEEYDSGTVTSETKTLTYTMATNLSTSMSGGSDVTTKSGFGVNASATYQNTISYTSTNNTDELGEVIVDYLDPVILYQDDPAYCIQTYNTGTVTMMIIPKHI